MSTLNIPLLWRRPKNILTLPLFASWPGAMINPQWLELLISRPALVAQLNARPNGDKEVTDSTPAGSATFFRGDLIMKCFIRSLSPFR